MSKTPVVEIASRSELAQCLERGDGYIYNAYPSLEPQMCPVHHASCGQTARMLSTSEEVLAIPKLWCADLDDLIDDIIYRRRSYRVCGSEAAVQPARHPRELDQRNTAGTNDDPPEPAEAPAALGPPQISVSGATAAGSYRILRSTSEVEYWSSSRVSFFVKDWRAPAQRELGTAVAALHAADGEALGAVYRSADRSRADAENVLIYNLWPFGLSRVAAGAVRFERSFEPPEPREADDVDRPYYSRYRLERASQGFSFWNRGEWLLAFDSVALPARIPTRCSPVWWAIKQSGSLVSRLPATRLDVFGVSMFLRLPAAPKGIAPAVIKVLFDGAIAASAFDNTARTRTDLDQIGQQVGVSTEAVRAALSDEARAPLGGLFMARRGGGGLQLSPPDDYCVAGELAVEYDPSLEMPRLSGSVFEVSGV